MSGNRVARLLALAACVGGLSSSAPSAPAAAAVLPEVLARVDGTPITAGEIRAGLRPLPEDLDHAQYELVEKALERAVERRLLDLEAAARGISTEELVEREVEARLDPPTEAEARAYWEANRAHLEDWRPEVAETLRRYLLQLRRLRRHTEWLARVRAAHEVRILLGPFRTVVSSAGSPAKGPPEAPVTLVTFSDFDCQACAELARSLERLVAEHGDRVRLVFRQFPAEGRAASRRAAEAALCADEQGGFWPMHDLLFAAERRGGAEGAPPPISGLELDAERYRECLDSGRQAARVGEDRAAGVAAGVASPPATFVNGRLVVGAPPYARLAALVKDELDRSGAAESR